MLKHRETMYVETQGTMYVETQGNDVLYQQKSHHSPPKNINSDWENMEIGTICSKLVEKSLGKGSLVGKLRLN
jgi:hypothetical protein